MSQSRNPFKKCSKVKELDFNSILPVFRFASALSGAVFLVSFVLMLLSLKEVETRVVYTMILIVNIMVFSGSLLVIRLVNRKNNKSVSYTQNSH